MLILLAAGVFKSSSSYQPRPWVLDSLVSSGGSSSGLQQWYGTCLRTTDPLEILTCCEVWPATLITTTVMNSLHDHSASDPSTSNGWRIGRYKFFLIVAGVTFVYEWIPEVIAQFLQIFTFVCWIAPNNVIVNQVFGGQTGLGILPISFDWSTITGFLLSPLQTPAFVIVNVGLGLVFMTIGCAGLAYGGPEFYKYLPIR